MRKANFYNHILVSVVLLLFGFYKGACQDTNESYDAHQNSSKDLFNHQEIPIEGLVAKYKPSEVLDYETAREVLFTEIYNENDTIRCVYSNYKLPVLKSEEDPISKLLKLNPLKSIIAEHSYPKSKGAKDGNAKSDMHHLFPVRLGVNVARYKHPFANISDNDCLSWYNDVDRFQSKPVGDLSKYAKKAKEAFEPQDNFKGNVARAVFYFFTMYRDEAMTEDDAFFELQRRTLLEWHQEDPIDALELERTYLIATYQSEKVNPFVIDETLALRLYGY
ncbi:endonuclease [Ulvibacter antarcticus]|uniref:Endonuclease I n=1 Tax=Ulvibacter antarcticus TaxID=442714 RepID=A0A3L9YTY3_9FLAO|nr:endonuclease [Ulvibacter antarcticus]RMA64211.1 endonuclease I [Ulvibacter antarcticus]